MSENEFRCLYLWKWAGAFTVLSISGLISVVGEAGEVRFEDRAEDLGAVFSNVEAPRNTIFEQIKIDGFPVPAGIPNVPHKPHGAPGVALLDFDGDDDLDIYVANSFGGANSLFANQLEETGHLAFVDVAVAAGVDAVDHDSTGVCFGDIDNDGDRDLMVLGALMANRLYENQGDGTFLDITVAAGVGGGALSTASCSMGDANGDGLLDIAVANTHNSWNDQLGILVPFSFNEHNQLYFNSGGNRFTDVSAASGFESLNGFPPEGAGAASVTWALAFVDYDFDGDVDMFLADDQGLVLPPDFGGINYGLIHLLRNDGAGNFTDVTVEVGLDKPGNWMGLSFGDYNCDGLLDIFATNVGDYPAADFPPFFPLGALSSRWFLGQPDGSWADPGVGGLVATPFGWGTATFDYDNDGDADIVYHGQNDAGLFIEASNPGAVLQNLGCSASFEFDGAALGQSADHSRRHGQGLAAGDLNRDGFVDLVTVSSANIPNEIPLIQRSFMPGSPFDATNFWVRSFAPDPADPSVWRFTGNEPVDGSLTVELSDAGNNNNWAQVAVRGTIGLTSGGVVNRDGIGAVVSFETRRGHQQTVPIMAGGSYASQGSLTAQFGMGSERKGTVEVVWPGGVRNRLKNVRRGEQLVFPEIPCDIATSQQNRRGYVRCVVRSIVELIDEDVLTVREGIRFLVSAL